jgi:hypothetical protein
MAKVSEKAEVSQLTYSTVPAASDIADSEFTVGNPLVWQTLDQVADNARLAAVRPELIYVGWFKEGDLLPLPISPVDGYVYQRAEARYLVQGFSTQPPIEFSSGQKTRPILGPSQGLKIDRVMFDIDDSLGQVLCNVYYESANPGFPGGGASGLTGDGCLKLLAICTRQSVNNDGGVN